METCLLFKGWLLLGNDTFASGKGLEQQAAWQVSKSYKSVHVCVCSRGGCATWLPFSSCHRAPSHGTHAKHGRFSDAYPSVFNPKQRKTQIVLERNQRRKNMKLGSQEEKYLAGSWSNHRKDAAL